MDSPALDVDTPPLSWTGRFDGDGAGHRRWWQVVAPWPRAGANAPAAQEQPTYGAPTQAEPTQAEPTHTEPTHEAPAQAEPTQAESIQEVPSPAAGPARPAVFLGFCSDEGVRRNHGRIGAATAPGKIRSALGTLAFHANRAVYDAGDVVVDCVPEREADPQVAEPITTGGLDSNGRDAGPKAEGLEAGQQRAGKAITTLLDAGALTIVLGGGHETAFASYLGISASQRIRGGARLGVLNLDAHFDLRDAPVPSSGTPFLQMARAEAAAGRTLNYAVVGISEPNNTRALFDTAALLDVKYLPDEDCTEDRSREFVESFLATVDVLYLTVDLDVLPAAVAPGVSAPAAYGVPLPVIAAICRQVAASGKLFHADVSEMNPEFDIDSRTAKVAARLVNTLLR